MQYLHENSLVNGMFKYSGILRMGELRIISSADFTAARSPSGIAAAGPDCCRTRKSSHLCFGIRNIYRAFPRATAALKNPHFPLDKPFG
jgi:hypothetical protein